MINTVLFWITIVILLATSIAFSLLYLHEKKKRQIVLTSHIEDTERLNKEHHVEIVTIKEQWCNEVTTIKEQWQNEIASVRKECELEITRTKESIERRKETLQLLPEKEILIDIMLALSGYASRIERLETVLSHEQISKQMNDIAVSTASKMKEMSNDILEHLNEMNIVERINDLSSTIVSQIEQNDVAGEITDLRSETDDIKSIVGDIKDTLGCQYDFSSVCGMLDSMSSDISNVKSEISSVNSSIDSLQSSVSSVCWAIDETKSAIESHY